MRFEFLDEENYAAYVTYTPNLAIAIRNAIRNGFKPEQLVTDGIGSATHTATGDSEKIGKVG